MPETERQEVPTRATCVVIGAGIVGNCLVGHLARLGWTDMVLLDKGPLPNPGGSTGHASNFIFPTDHNKEMAVLTLESQRQYVELGVNGECGGIEVARTPERMEEFNRRMTSAKAWGIDARLLTPAEIKELVPFVDESVVLGGFYTPSVSVVDSLQAGTLMREEAVASGALQVFANTEVLSIETEPGADGGDGRPVVRAVVTNKGRIACDHVAIACGVWSPRIAEMAGATIPLTPAVHQMADVGPIEVLVETNKEVAFPIVRDMDTFCYERQSAGSMEVGSYAHRPIFHHPDDIPSNEESALSPTELPFTADDFDRELEGALELMGEILETAEIRYAINGLLSLTPDAMPVLGETVEVANLWSAAAVWIKEGPGIAQLVAEWMTHGYPARVRPAHQRHQPLLPARADGASHPRPLRRALQQDVRHRAPTGAVGERAGNAPQPVLRARRGARRGVLRRPRLGTSAVVREQRRAVREVPAGQGRPTARVGPPLVVADHQRRAPGDARQRRHGRPHRVQRVRHRGTRRQGRAAVHRRQQRRRAGGQVDLHAAAHAGRRVPRRPHDPAPRGASTTG